MSDYTTKNSPDALDALHAVCSYLNIPVGKRDVRLACPIHYGKNKTAFSVDTIDGLAKCWSDCGKGWNMFQLCREFGLRIDNHYVDTVKTKRLEKKVKTKSKSSISTKKKDESKKSDQQKDKTKKIPKTTNTIKKYFDTTDSNTRLIDVRYEKADGTKTFSTSVQKLCNGKWGTNRNLRFDGEDFKALPYGHEKFDKCNAVVVVEGVKCVDALNAISELDFSKDRSWRGEATATTSIGGSSSSHKTDWSCLEGKHVVFIPDCDKPGMKYAKSIAKKISKSTGNIFLVKLDEFSRDDVNGYDIADFISDGNALSELVAEKWNDFEEDYVESNDKNHFNFTDLNTKLLTACFDRLGVELRYNTRAKSPEILSDGKWKSLRANKELSYFGYFRDNFTYSKQYKDRKVPKPINFGSDCRKVSLANFYEQRRVDPFKNWLENLPKWDEDDRLSNMLNDMFGMHDKKYKDLYEWASRFIFVGAIRRVFEPGCQLRQIPILIGEQNIGKSALLRSVLPSDMQEDLFGDTLNMMDDVKSQIESIQGKVIVEISELVGLTKAELAKVKAFLTRRNDEVRMAYAPRKEKMLRECIIVGTTNDDACLPNDPSGNSRFVPIKLEHGCNVEEYMDNYREQLWAEALFIYEQKNEQSIAILPRTLYALQEKLAGIHKRVNTEVDDLVDMLGENDITGCTTTAIRQQIKNLLKDYEKDKDVYVPRVNLFSSSLISRGYKSMQIDGGRRWFKSRRSVDDWRRRTKLQEEAKQRKAHAKSMNRETKFSNPIVDI